MAFDDVNQILSVFGVCSPSPMCTWIPQLGCCLGPGGPEFPDQFLDRLVVVPPADGADHLGLLGPVVGDGGVGNDLPSASLGVAGDPGVVGAADVLDRGAKVVRR